MTPDGRFPQTVWGDHLREAARALSGPLRAALAAAALERVSSIYRDDCTRKGRPTTVLAGLEALWGFAATGTSADIELLERRWATRGSRR